MHDNIFALFAKPWFWSAILAWTIAQLAKMLAGFIRTRRLNFAYLLSTGGMPSAHSALVCALATSLGITEGFDSPIAVLAAAFASITMFDAAVVRRASGQQARILNHILDEIFEKHRISEKRLKELLGHTRLEVFVGLVLGILCAVVLTANWR